MSSEWSMQIHYCYTCNKRVEDDDTVTLEDKVYCRACAAKVEVADDLPLGRSTPARGLQRRTPGNKTPARPGPSSPGRGSQTPPPRSSKTNIRPATPAKGVTTRPGVSRASGGNAIPPRASGANVIPPRSSGANAIPPRASTTNITPARSSGAARRPSGGNPTLSGDKSAGRASANDEGAQQHNESRRGRGNNTLIWVLAAVAMLLAGVGAALLVGGNSITSPPPSTQPK